MFKIDDWIPSIWNFLEYWRVIRICPNQIEAPEKLLTFNILTAAISLVILMLARMSVAGASPSIAVTVIAMMISVFIIFLTGYITLIRNSGADGIGSARKWGAFFVAVWITSLMGLIVLDAVPFWSGYSPLTTTVINFIFGPGNVPPVVKDLIRGVFFGLLAVTILLYKSRRMDNTFRIFNVCALSTIGLGLLMNTALMQLFIYTHFV